MSDFCSVLDNLFFVPTASFLIRQFRSKFTSFSKKNGARKQKIVLNFKDIFAKISSRFALSFFHEKKFLSEFAMKLPFWWRQKVSTVVKKFVFMIHDLNR